jgi:hypothetical protein
MLLDGVEHVFDDSHVTAVVQDGGAEFGVVAGDAGGRDGGFQVGAFDEDGGKKIEAGMVFAVQEGLVNERDGVPAHRVSRVGPALLRRAARSQGLSRRAGSARRRPARSRAP